MKAEHEAAAPARTETAVSQSNRAQTNTSTAPPQARELPQFLRDMISAPPRAGTGVHTWIFKIARHLHHHRAAADIEKLLATAAEGCGRHVSEKEIRDAVENSKAAAWTPNGQPAPIANPAPRWPAVDANHVRDITSTGFTEYDLWESSPVRIEGGTPDTEWFIDGLFPADVLLCVGRTSASFRTAPREKLRGTLANLALVVPSPMSAVWGETKAGRRSMHTMQNTGPRTYLVTEFDGAERDAQACVIAHLAELAPLAMVLFSGGKSLHAWWNCRNIPEPKQRAFFRHAVSLGADPMTWARSQFVRMPGGWRGDKRTRQDVIFFNPEAAAVRVERREP